MIRLFAALSVPPEIAEGLARRQHGIEGARWRTLEALHVTLRFFGDVREDVAADLDAELSGIVSPPLEVELQGVTIPQRPLTRRLPEAGTEHQQRHAQGSDEQGSDGQRAAHGIMPASAGRPICSNS